MAATLSPPVEWAGRYATTVPIADRRVFCHCGHTFTPDLTLRQGRGSVSCRSCHQLLLVAVLRDTGQRLIMAVTRPEIEALERLTIRPGFDLLWLVLQPTGSIRSDT